MLPLDLLASIALLSFGRVANAASASEWASRSIYQIMTDRFALTDGSEPACNLTQYCGGTWTGIKNKLDYIQGMGFSAIQISPVVQNFAQNTIHGEAFHGYWPTDWYALNENFGTAEDLKGLAKALHERDMLLMVDVVINDVAWPISKDMTADTVFDYSPFKPFNDAKYYHPWCNLSDFNNIPIMQNCWLGSVDIALPDLKTEDPVVGGMINSWVKELISNYSIDGLRIDAAKHVGDQFLQDFVKEAGVFTFGEVYNDNVSTVCNYANFMEGLPNFPVYFPLIGAFAEGSMYWLARIIEEVSVACKNIFYMGTFSENHDLPRFASLNPDLIIAKNAVAFTILADGIPTMYQSQEQHVTGNYTPFNRSPAWQDHYSTTAPLYNLTATLNKLRNHASYNDPLYIGTKTIKLDLREQYYVTRKGSEGKQVVAAYFNTGAAIPDSLNATITIQGGFAPRTSLVEVVSCREEEVDSAGGLMVVLDGLPKVYYSKAGLEGSGVCGRALVRVPKKVDDDVGSGTGNETKEGGDDGKGGDTKDGKDTGEKKSEGNSMRLKVRASFAGGALGVVFMAALVWL